MSEEAKELWKYAPVVALLIGVLWAGHKGFWYWGPSVRTIIEKLEQERDDWKRLAFALMEKCGIKMPVNLLPGSSSFKKKEEK